VRALVRIALHGAVPVSTPTRCHPLCQRWLGCCQGDDPIFLYDLNVFPPSLPAPRPLPHRQPCSCSQDIRILKLKIGELKRELTIQNSKSGEITELRREVYRLQKELLQEKTKVKALSEELENPMNVHRWRKLEGSDPATYEMIQKIQTLQKRLISKVCGRMAVAVAAAVVLVAVAAAVADW
jgi:hypothetical protein